LNDKNGVKAMDEVLKKIQKWRKTAKIGRF